MNLFSVEKSFDGNKYTFFFTCEGRVDFRQLVKMMVKQLGVRIEMRQVGIRNQAKMCVRWSVRSRVMLLCLSGKI